MSEGSEESSPTTQLAAVQGTLLTMPNRLLRILHLVLTPLLLAALSYEYARNVDHTQLEVSELSFPVDSDTTAYIPFGVIRQIDGGLLRVVHRGKAYDLAGTIDRARSGDVISLEVLARRDGTLEMVRGHLHRYRKFKWLSGVVALIVLSALMTRSLRFTGANRG